MTFDDFFDDLAAYEICFPGAVSGEAEVECPHCGILLTVSVSDPMGADVCKCVQCCSLFNVDWGT